MCVFRCLALLTQGLSLLAGPWSKPFTRRGSHPRRFDTWRSRMIAEIIIGLLSSIIATLFFHSLRVIGLFGDKQSIHFEMEQILRCFYEISEKISFEEVDYSRVMEKMDEAMKLILKTSGMIKGLTYWLNQGRKKMILTSLHQLYRLCEASLNVTVGYSKDEELSARCHKINHYFNDQAQRFNGFSKPVVLIELAICLNQTRPRRAHGMSLTPRYQKAALRAVDDLDSCLLCCRRRF